MFRKTLFTLVCVVSTLLLVYTLMVFMPFISSLKEVENDLDAPTLTLFTIDVCLVVLFMSQHSGLASSTYRQTMEELGLGPVARAVYVMLSSLMLQLLMYLWQPIPEVKFWELSVEENTLLSIFFQLLHIVLWIVLMLQILVLEPLHLIGIKQVYYYVKNDFPESYINPRLRQLISHYPPCRSGMFYCPSLAPPMYDI